LKGSITHLSDVAAELLNVFLHAMLRGKLNPAVRLQSSKKTTTHEYRFVEINA
jgi:hypothetical protein